MKEGKNISEEFYNGTNFPYLLVFFYFAKKLQFFSFSFFHMKFDGIE